ncbi:hypothetical protein K8I61_02255 [bacterium]|nr:hypothetical protein [bacterium]
MVNYETNYGEASAHCNPDDFLNYFACTLEASMTSFFELPCDYYECVGDWPDWLPPEGFTVAAAIASPPQIKPDTRYLFEFEVENTSPMGNGNWIDAVNLLAPDRWLLQPGDAINPPSLHGEGDWINSLSYDPPAIRWEYVPYDSSTGGDVREGEKQTFLFYATTDSLPGRKFEFTAWSYLGPWSTGNFSLPRDPDDDAVDDDASDDDTPDDDSADDDEMSDYDDDDDAAASGDDDSSNNDSADDDDDDDGNGGFFNC